VAETDPRGTPHPSNLPIRLTPLVGRTREIAELRAELERPEVRLLTLTGSGGSGKTRLALAVATEALATFQDGVVFVDLAPVSDAVLVLSTIASALNSQGLVSATDPVATPTNGEQSGAEDVAQLTAISDVLRERRLLLVLDNFEQLLAAAPQVAGLLQACPRLKILVTSRSVLHLEGEHEYPVPLLGLPDLAHLPSPDEIAQHAAVELFVQRARAVKPDFALTEANAAAVAAICVHLDGLPLAIELAAARIRLLPPQALLGRLSNRLALLTDGARNLPTRQQTLRATLDWSYGLLSPEEQALFTRLGALVGSWTLEAAEAIAGSDEAASETLEGLASLMDKSLLRQEATPEGEGRFRMLETIRDYANERLDASGEVDAIKQRHVAYFLAFAEEAAPHLRGPQQAAWLARLERDHDNLRLALRWALESGNAAAAVRLGAALWRFWWILGHLGEGQRWLAAVLEGSQLLTASVQVRALSGAWAMVSHAMAPDPASYAQATVFFTDTLSLCRELGDARGIALSLGNLGLVATGQGAVEQGISLLEESLALLRELGDRERIASALSNLGAASLQAGDARRAEAVLQESLQIRRELNDRPAVAATLTALARAAVSRGDQKTASALLGEALTLSRESGAAPVVAEAIEQLAQLALASGKAEQAARLFGAAGNLRQATGTVLSATAQLALDRDVAAAQAALGDTDFAVAWAAGGALSREAVVAQALAVLALSPILPRPAQAVNPAHPLTAREAQVAALIAQGKTNREIADALIIAEGTTERHVANILSKLGFNSRARIAAWATERGLLQSQAS
jgi:predicted ATPase/DNA-binding NarL/FixJ family response regulator